MKTQTNKPITNVNPGAAKNNTQLARTGIIISLTNNFKPSANACSSPQNPVTFGPLRRWIEANNLRSAKVKKAIDNKAVIIVINIEIINKFYKLNHFSIAIIISTIPIS